MLRVEPCYLGLGLSLDYAGRWARAVGERNSPNYNKQRGRADKILTLKRRTALSGLVEYDSFGCQLALIKF